MNSAAKRSSIISAPGAPALFASSILARLPLAMFGIALLVHAQRLTGSFAVAGLVSGAYALSRAVASPLVGRLVDRCGQTRILLWGSGISALLLVGMGLLPAGAPAPLLVVLAAAIGLATPPLAACVRTLLPAIVTDPSALPAAYAFESTSLELTFIFGPPLALGFGLLWSTGAALAFSGLVMLAATLAFAAQPASQRWRPDAAAPRSRGGSLGAPAIRTLVFVLVAVGAVFGAVDVGVTAAAKQLGSAAAAGPLLGLWGVGSLLGGVAATHLGGGARGARGLTLLLAVLALGHAALITTTASALALGAALVVAGASIAPTFAGIYAMVDKAAPAGTRTEAFAWLMTASSTGGSLGAVAAGALVQSAGASAAFALAGAAGALAVVIALLGSRGIGDAASERAVVVAPAVAV
jgi:MFS family permease